MGNRPLAFFLLCAPDASALACAFASYTAILTGGMLPGPSAPIPTPLATRLRFAASHLTWMYYHGFFVPADRAGFPFPPDPLGWVA